MLRSVLARLSAAFGRRGPRGGRHAVRRTAAALVRPQTSDHPLAGPPAPPAPSGSRPTSEPPTLERPISERPTLQQPSPKPPISEEPAPERRTSEPPTPESPPAEQPVSDEPPPVDRVGLVFADGAQVVLPDTDPSTEDIRTAAARLLAATDPTPPR